MRKYTNMKCEFNEMQFLSCFDQGGLPDKFCADKLQRDVTPIKTDTKSWWPVAAAVGLSAFVLAVVGSR